MELSSQEGEIPIPLNSSFGHGHGHMIHHDHHAPHNHMIAASAAAAPQPQSQIPSGATDLDDDHDHDHDLDHSHNHNHSHSHNHNHNHNHNHVGFNKKAVKYRECLKNHAAAMGGTATDGCGEFMPSGEEGSIEALTCSACNCHRNFHRKEIEGEPSSFDCTYPLHSPHHHHLNRVGRKLILGHHKSILPPEALGLGYPTPTGTLIHSRSGGGGGGSVGGAPPTPTPHQMIMSYNTGMGMGMGMGIMGTGCSLPSESDEQEEAAGGGGGGVVVGRPPQLVKKRFRTKFSQEQKEKMLNFAEKVGWKIQKQEEAVVQQFCQEIGVKRRVLKVWMHNNKHNLAKKNNPNSTATTTTAATATAAS